MNRNQKGRTFRLDLVLSEYIFRIDQELETLAGKLDIWEVHHDEGWLLAQVSERTVEWISSNGFQYEIDRIRTANLKNTNHLAPGQMSGIPGYSCYRTVEETDSSLKNLYYQLPNSCKDCGHWR